MKPIVLTLAWLVCAGALVACDSAPMPSPITDDSPRRNSAYVFSNGWHTAIVVARDKAVAIGVLPEAADFPTAAFLEFGWGDRTYYPAKDKTLGMGFSTAQLQHGHKTEVPSLSPPPLAHSQNTALTRPSARAARQ